MNIDAPVLVTSAAASAEATMRLLSDADIASVEVSSGEEALSLLDDGVARVLLCDLHLPDMSAMDLLHRTGQGKGAVQVVVLVDHREIEQGVEALRSGASDFMVRPLSAAALDVCLRRARERMVKENGKLESVALDAPQLTFQQLFDAVPCYISVQDRNLRITRANRRFKEDFGEPIGAYCYEIYKHRSTPCPNCPVEAAFGDGNPHQTEEIVTTKGGRQHNVLIWTAPIRDESGSITHVMEIATDITKIRELQDHLTNLGLMIGSVSHGIKGMLTALDGGMYKLESGVTRRNYDKIEEGSDLIKRMVKRIRDTVLDILFYAKERDLNWENVNVVQFTEGIANIVDAKAKNDGIRLIRDIDDSLGVFEIDPSVVSSALVNILENAIEACRDDASKENHEIRFSVTRESGDVVFEVCDNGPGVDRETREKMFSLFFSSKGSKGTGLGLFIANDVIRQHGGHIDVRSELGEGTCFTITLPASCPMPHGHAPAPGRSIALTS